MVMDSRKAVGEEGFEWGADFIEAEIRGRIRNMIEGIVAEELEAALGAGKSQRVGAARGGYRHGSRERQTALDRLHRCGTESRKQAQPNEVGCDRQTLPEMREEHCRQDRRETTTDRRGNLKTQRHSGVTNFGGKLSRKEARLRRVHRRVTDR